MSADQASIVKSVRNALLSRLDGRILDPRFDHRHKIRTCRHRALETLTIASDNREIGRPYEGTPVRLFSAMMSRLPRDLGSFVFVDLGSGAGRTLLLASCWNFKRIVGIEFAEELHHAALRNIESFTNSRQRCRQIESRCLDAANAEIPDENCVLYFFNPFRGEVVTSILRNVHRSYTASPRKLYFVYCNPQPTARRAFRAAIRELGFLEPMAKRLVPLSLSLFSQYDVDFYETILPTDRTGAKT